MKQDILTIHKAVRLSHRFNREGRERRREKHREAVARNWPGVLKFLANPEPASPTPIKAGVFGRGPRSVPAGYNATETARERRERTGVR